MKRSKSMRAVLMKPDGSTQAQDHEVAPNSRRTIHIDDIPGLQATEFSTGLRSTNDSLHNVLYTGKGSQHGA